MKYLSPLISQGSGSVAGCVFSHNRFGKYIRNRTVPVNPNSLDQQTIKTVFSDVAMAWNLILDDTQRNGWKQYAASVPKVDPLGQTIYLTGFNWFCAVNTLRRYFGKALAPTPPTVFNLTPLQPITISGTAPGTLNVTYVNSDEWAIQAGGHLFIFCGLNTNQTVNFFKGPFRKGGVVNGAATPPTSPAVIAHPFSMTAGQRIWARAIAVTADNRLSVPQIVSGTVV